MGEEEEERVEVEGSIVSTPERLPGPMAELCILVLSVLGCQELNLALQLITTFIILFPMKIFMSRFNKQLRGLVISSIYYRCLGSCMCACNWQLSINLSFYNLT